MAKEKSFYFHGGISWECANKLSYPRNYDATLTGAPEPTNGIEYSEMGTYSHVCESESGTGLCQAKNIMADEECNGTDWDFRYDEVYDCWYIDDWGDDYDYDE